MIEKVTEMNLNYLKIPFYQMNGQDADQNPIMTEYEYTLLENAGIPGIAKVSKQLEEGKVFLMYSISSYISLEEKIAKGCLNKEVFFFFFKQLIKMYENIQLYLLDFNSLNLNPAYIFYDERTKQYVFLIGTADRGSILEKFENLLTFFADICPIEQQELLEYIFELFGSLSESNFEAHAFLKYILKCKFEDSKNEGDTKPVVLEEDVVLNNESDTELETKKNISSYLISVVCLVLAVFFAFFVEYEFKYCVVGMTLGLLATGFMVFQVYSTIEHKRKSQST